MENSEEEEREAVASAPSSLLAPASALEVADLPWATSSGQLPHSSTAHWPSSPFPFTPKVGNAVLRLPVSGCLIILCLYP